ncbi:actin-related protein 4 isoform X1 [Iris pallida]|uniref:Actin-related protein 4 isoform X1 n=1 Tax=Iris pallida TaxID=29817 RepID=A0AAX6EB08_IRIPA|nr:actin-related protein 4 isoform X1 [Iris pallida]
MLGLRDFIYSQIQFYSSPPPNLFLARFIPHYFFFLVEDQRFFPESFSRHLATATTLSAVSVRASPVINVLHRASSLRIENSQSPRRLLQPAFTDPYFSNFDFLD